MRNTLILKNPRSKEGTDPAIVSNPPTHITSTIITTTMEDARVVVKQQNTILICVRQTRRYRNLEFRSEFFSSLRRFQKTFAIITFSGSAFSRSFPGRPAGDGSHSYLNDRITAAARNIYTYMYILLLL